MEFQNKEMIQDILNKDELDKQDIVSLLKAADENDLQMIFQKADAVRKEYCGNEVHLRGIIEFSNYCEQDCLYCGLRKSNKTLPRYRMTKEEIIQTAKEISEAGIKTIVLQSGEDFYISGKEIEELIKTIKDRFGSAVTLSLGERGFEEYKTWKEAGAYRYLLKHETSSERLYSAYHLGQELKERIEHLEYLKSLGYQTGSGNLIGLPQQSIEDIAGDITLCRKLEADMVSFSPFIPSPDTPYRNHKPAAIDFTLKVMAIARIVLKNVHMPATTALATLDADGWEKGLAAGANVIMPNFTPAGYRNKYLIYPNKKSDGDFLTNLFNLISSSGRFISAGYGNTLKKKIPSY